MSWNDANDNVWPVVGAARSNIMAVWEGFSQTVFTDEAKQKNYLHLRFNFTSASYETVLYHIHCFMQKGEAGISVDR